MAKIFIGKKCPNHLIDKILDLQSESKVLIELHPMDNLTNIYHGKEKPEKSKDDRPAR